MHYLDNAATTAVDEQVRAAVCDTLARYFANPSSLYEAGFEAEQVIEGARQVVAGALGAAAKEIIFTGNGSESNSLAIWGAVLARKAWADSIVMTGYEHPSVDKAMRLVAEQFGLRLVAISPDENGHVDVDALLAAVGPKTALVCAMHVNNEVGSILDVADIAERVKRKNSRTAVHVDGVQAFTKLPLRLKGTKIDSYAVSGHKIHAPKGIGALYLRSGYHFVSPFAGGGQEQGLRPGTENTAYIAGLGKAVELCGARHMEHRAAVEALHRRLADGLKALEGVEFNSPEDGLPGIVNISLPGQRSETVLHFLAARGILLSAGSACSSGQPSHTLTAMGKRPERIASALRISFDGTNTEADIDALLAALPEAMGSIASGRVGGKRR